MTLVASRPSAAVRAATAAPHQPTDSVVLRSALFAGCLVTAGWAAWFGTPQPLLQADAELALLLRGMAAIKAAMVIAGIGALFWRFGRPVSRGLAWAYLLGIWAAAGAGMLIWQLSAIALAAFVFHAGGLALLVAAWRDGRSSTR